MIWFKLFYVMNGMAFDFMCTVCTRTRKSRTSHMKRPKGTHTTRNIETKTKKEWKKRREEEKNSNIQVTVKEWRYIYRCANTHTHTQEHMLVSSSSSNTLTQPHGYDAETERERDRMTEKCHMPHTKMYRWRNREQMIKQELRIALIPPNVFECLCANVKFVACVSVSRFHFVCIINMYQYTKMDWK